MEGVFSEVPSLRIPEIDRTLELGFRAVLTEAGIERLDLRRGKGASGARSQDGLESLISARIRSLDPKFAFTAFSEARRMGEEIHRGFIACCSNENAKKRLAVSVHELVPR